MTIDFFAGIGRWPFRDLECDTHFELVERLSGAGIDRAVVYPITSILGKDCMWGNRELAEAAALHPERLIPFACVNPAFPGWERDFAACFDGMGFRGLRLFPTYHGYSPGDGCVAEIVAAARERRAPIVIAVRVEDERQHHPAAMVPPLDINAAVDMIASFPETHFVVSGATYSEMCAAKPGLTGCDNWCFDTARMQGRGAGPGPVEVIVRLVTKFGARRVLFGSNTPFQYIESSLLKVLKAPIPGGDRDLILSGNALRLLNEAGL